MRKISETDLSKFEMLVTAPYELPDPKTMVPLLMGGVREEEKIFGPAFTAKYIKYALEFTAEKLGEKSPEGIKTLDQLAEYLLSISSKHPKVFLAEIYAQIHVENTFLGQIGAGTRVLEIGANKFVDEKESDKKRSTNIKEILFKLRETAIQMKFAPKEHGYRINGDGSADMLWPNCYFRDVCEPAYYQGSLAMPTGKMRCGITAFVCQYFKKATGFEWDYERIEAYKGYCIIRIRPI
ncbi:MAG: hypothetical protein QW279_14370 [Candidatus Jordarchaeaceae archaeon]